MKARYLLSALFTLLLFTSCSAESTSAESELDWMTDFEAATAKAKESGKPLLMDFTGSDWCGWCIKLDKEVFSKKAFADYAEDNLVLLKLDFPKRKKISDEVKLQNEKLAKRFGIRGFPTILLMNPEGDLIAKTGYQRGGAEKYVEHLKGLLEE